MHKLIITAFAALVLAGCSTGRQIVTGTVRTPVPPEQVRVYHAAPPAFEEIAIVTAEAKGKSQRASDKALRRLKERAGKLGANGLILNGLTVNKGFVMYGWWYVPTDETSISGSAIYVH